MTPGQVYQALHTIPQSAAAIFAPITHLSMNRTSTILSSIALLGVIILFVLHFSANKRSAGTSTTKTTVPSGALRVAYVDIDTFEANYHSLKTKKAEFSAQQAAMESELQRSAQQMQADIANVQRKAEANTLSQTEYEAAQKRIGQMQQALETRRQTMSTQFQDKLEAFNKELHIRMDEFLEEYTKEHDYDYVLSYTRSNPLILYGNKSLNITNDVIKGMNDRAGKTDSKDSVKSK
jgi:outer membrane protein